MFVDLQAFTMLRRSAKCSWAPSHFVSALKNAGHFLTSRGNVPGASCSGTSEQVHSLTSCWGTQFFLRPACVPQLGRTTAHDSGVQPHAIEWTKFATGSYRSL